MRSRNATPSSDQPMTSNGSSVDAASIRVPLLFHPWINSYLVTLSFLFSLYSSLQCTFMVLDIGFEPTNEDFIRKEMVTLGPLSGEDNEGNCYIYSDEFHEAFIDGDVEFNVSRIGTFVSICTGFLSFIMIWFMYIGAIPNTPCCKIVLLISVLITTISEAVKFSIFGTQICKAEMWIEKGAFSTEVPKECSMGLGGKLSIACIPINLSIIIKILIEQWVLYRLCESGINGRRHRGDDTITTATTLQKQASKNTISSDSSEELSKKTKKRRNKSSRKDSSSSNESDEDIEKAHFLETKSNSGADYYRKKRSHQKHSRSKKNKDGGEKNIFTDDELQGILSEEEKREILQNDWSDSDNEDENDADWKQRKKDMNIDYF